MLEMKYEAGSPDGKVKEFVFQAANNRINKSDIRDYEWNYKTQFSKVKRFYKELKTASIPIFFYQRRSASDTQELYHNAERMYATFDRDVRSMKPGKLWVGDYYINCYIVASKKKEYDNGVVIEMTLTVLSDFRWRKIASHTFGLESGGGGGGGTSEFLDFEYDFEYDYSSSPDTSDLRKWQAESIAPFDFRIEFQGPVDDPELIVGGQIYRVYTEVAESERLIVDSLERRVYRKLIDGTEINEFNNRDKDYPIFQPMPISEGITEVTWTEGHVVTLYAYIERSEPKWI